MTRNGVTEKDHGWKGIKEELAKAHGSGVKVGVLADSEADYEDADVLTVAAANELGTETTPARPFIRGAYDNHQKELARTKERLIGLLMQGKLSARQALQLLGEEHQGQIQEYMEALSAPPNAPRTIARKGSANPLIDEGRLLESVRWEYDE